MQAIQLGNPLTHTSTSFWKYHGKMHVSIMKNPNMKRRFAAQIGYSVLSTVELTYPMIKSLSFSLLSCQSKVGILIPHKYYPQKINTNNSSTSPN